MDGESVAAVECSVYYICYAAGNRHAHKSAAPYKGTSDSRYAVRDSHACKIYAALKSAFSDTCYTIGDNHACKPHAVQKQASANALYAIRYYHARKAFLILECTVAYTPFSITKSLIGFLLYLVFL